ncbi:hypothetical protein [Albidovulum aquaemixtae]|uniref:hypothetical protein n=1 Tax=Albidovulum aquaemixtae TaxID=1542388 RepID=UPI001FEC6C56|nr:hypothetical protein [Defluviimonas aquaemixtae]
MRSSIRRRDSSFRLSRRWAGAGGVSTTSAAKAGFAIASADNASVPAASFLRQS